MFGGYVDRTEELALKDQVERTASLDTFKKVFLHTPDVMERLFLVLIWRLYSLSPFSSSFFLLNYEQGECC